MTTQETILTDGHPVDVSYFQHPDKLSVTIAPHLPVTACTYAVLSSTVGQWLDQLAFDLYGCVSNTSDQGNRLTIELSCPQKEEALIRAVPILHALLRSQSVRAHHEPAASVSAPTE